MLDPVQTLEYETGLLIGDIFKCENLVPKQVDKG